MGAMACAAAARARRELEPGFSRKKNSKKARQLVACDPQLSSSSNHNEREDAAKKRTTHYCGSAHTATWRCHYG